MFQLSEWSNADLIASVPLTLRLEDNAPIIYKTNLYSKGFVNLVLNRQAVAVPAKPALHMEAILVGIASHHVL